MGRFVPLNLFSCHVISLVPTISQTIITVDLEQLTFFPYLFDSRSISSGCSRCSGHGSHQAIRETIGGHESISVMTVLQTQTHYPGYRLNETRRQTKTKRLSRVHTLHTTLRTHHTLHTTLRTQYTLHTTHYTPHTVRLEPWPFHLKIL